VDDELLIFQEKSYEKLNANLFCSCNIISSIFNQFSLVIKHNKLKVFYFSRSTKNIHLTLLDLRPLEGPLFYLKDMWWYLVFFFDKKLSFYQHVYHYTNKALSTIQSMKMLKNSNRELSPIHKYLFYKTCVLSIALYGF